MKLRIWCTVHYCSVVAADNDANTVLVVPKVDENTYYFEVDESNLYCMQPGDSHNFELYVIL